MIDSQKFLGTIKDEYVDLDNYDILKTQRTIDLFEIVIEKYAPGNNSFVIGLQGSLGSGKNSVLKINNTNPINFI